MDDLSLHFCEQTGQIDRRIDQRGKSSFWVGVTFWNPGITRGACEEIEV